MDHHYLKGIELGNKGDFQSAINSFSESIKTSGPFSEVFYNRGMAYYRLEKFTEAISDMDAALEISPQNPHLISQKGVALFMSGKKSEALEHLDQALALEPENPYRYSSRAFIKNSMGDVQGAIADYETAIRIDPEDSVSLNNLGMIEEQAGYKEAAKKRFALADEIADKGKTFEKPDVDAMINSMNEKKDANKKQFQKIVDENAAARKNNNGAKEYLDIVKSVFSDKQVFEEFADFVKKKIGLGKK